MTTALGQQLKQLAIPQTKALLDQKNRASLLFEPSEAAKLSRDAVYDIGITGLNELIKIDAAFASFRDNLFNITSKDLQRVIQSKQINDDLNKVIASFLRHLGPYLMLKPAHKALEWLIHRYQIHNLNPEQLIALILPYHESNIFVRLLQLLDLKSHALKNWAWLEPFQKKALALPKNVLVQQVHSNPVILQFINEMAEKGTEGLTDENAAKVRILMGFFTSIVSAVARSKTNDHILTILLPTLFKGLRSDNTDFKSAAYIILSQLLINSTIHGTVAKMILSALIEDTKENSRVKKLALLLIIFQRQLPPPDLSFNQIKTWDWAVPILAEFGGRNILVGPLIFAMIEACLANIFQPNRDDNDVEAQLLVWNLAEQILLDDASAVNIFKLFVKYLEGLTTETKKPKRDTSAADWLKVVVETFSSKYAEVFDKIQDVELRNLRRLYGGEGVDERLNLQIKSLLRKCTGPGHLTAWRQLKPILWQQIDDHRTFKAWLKGSPPDEPLTLILLIDRLLRPGSTPEAKKLLIIKVANSTFGQNCEFINRLLKNLETNESSIPEAIKLTISYNVYDLNNWLAVLNELRVAGKINWKNPVWLFCFKILIPLIQPDSEVNSDVLKILSFISALKFKHQASLITDLIGHVKSKIPFVSGFNVDFTPCLRVTILEILFKAYHASSRHAEQFSSTLDDFIQSCFPDSKTATGFFYAISGGFPFSAPNIGLQIYALHFIWMKLREKNGDFYDYWVSDTKLAVCYLLSSLTSQSKPVRKAAVKLLETVSEDRKIPLLNQLKERSDEIIADANHIRSAFSALYSENGSGSNQDFQMLISVVNSTETPLYLATHICSLLENVSSLKTLKDLTVFGERALKAASPKISNAALTSYWRRLNPTVVDALNDKKVWQFASDCLQVNKTSDDFCPPISFIKPLSKKLFAAMDGKTQERLFNLLVTVRAETGNVNISAAIATVCRKIALNGSTVHSLLEKMVTALPSDRSTEPQNILKLSEWRHGICVLELIQNKKKLDNAEILIQTLFSILKFCLDQEEQTGYEYAKQLVLGLLLQICQRTIKLDSTVLDVELIVHCLRASPNPQTHHHALLLLSRLASIIPVRVMHNMMAIFTFMGSSLTRLDDEHSVQVVIKVVDAIVPVLVGNLESEGDAVVAEVLRIFVWALRDVPQHRRLPLFSRLLTTLEPNRACWVFLLLLFENYVVCGVKAEKSSDASMPASLQLGLELVLSFGPLMVLQTALKIIRYLIQIPMERMNPPPGVQLINADYNPNGLFDIEKHSAKQLRHFTYTLATFLNSMLADQNLVIQVRELDSNTSSELENVFRDAIAALLLYAPLCAAQQQLQPNKFWKVLETLSYDVLDKLASLISSKTLVGVITKLLEPEDVLRRKAVDLLNAHIQAHRGGFSVEEKSSLQEIVVPVLEVAASSSSSDIVRQTALLSLRLLAKVLAAEQMALFKTVLVEVCKLCKSKGHLLASAALTIADIVAQLKVHALSELPKFLPPILKSLTKFITAERNDIVLMSLCAALYRIIEVLVAFLTPYLDTIIYVISCLTTRWPDIADLNRKIIQTRQKISANVPHRFLIPTLGRVTKQLIDEGKLTAIGPLLTLLADSFSSCSDVSKLTNDLTPFYLQILQIRSDAADGKIKVSEADILTIEEFAIDAILPFVLKLSELSFKPLYYQIFHWASEHPHRSITFYRLSCKIADRFKGLFVLFAGLFLQNAANLLDANNVTKTDKRYFGDDDEGEAKAILLIESIIKTLHSLFMFDSSTFLNKEKFQILLHPLVDQLDNTLGGAEKLEERSKRLLSPCLAQMALATDDTQWKVLNYQLLDKTRSPSPLVRIAALQTIAEMAAKLGEDYLPLLPETIGPLAELFEDEDERVEEAMKEALRRMEEDLGEPIREYFQ